MCETLIHPLWVLVGSNFINSQFELKFEVLFKTYVQFEESLKLGLNEWIQLFAYALRHWVDEFHELSLRIWLELMLGLENIDYWVWDIWEWYEIEGRLGV